jgi:nitronate monooxygenase
MSVFDDRSFERHVEALKPTYADLGLDPPKRPDRFGQSFVEQVAALIDARPPVFSFVFGIPSPEIIRACKDQGIVTIGNATTVEEARAIEAAGVDMIVATGAEAGGHRVSFLQKPDSVLTGTFSLVRQVRNAVCIPVIAAGGIVDGRGVAAALVLGADAAQIGTAFLACEESGASPLHRTALFSTEAQHTTLTRAFSGRLARMIRNRFVDVMESHPCDIAPYPAQNWLTGSLRSAAIEQDRSDLIPLYAGQSAPLLRYKSAHELFSTLVTEADQILKGTTLHPDGSRIELNEEAR